MGRRRVQEGDYDPVAIDLARDVKLAVAPREAQRPPEATTPAAAPAPLPVACGMKAKRYKVTLDEDVTLARFVLRLQEASGTKVNLALLNRVTNGVLMNAEEDLIREIRGAGPMRQPSNNDAIAFGDFEDTWRRIVERAVRRRGARP